MRLSPLLLFATYLTALAVATLWPFNFFQQNLAQSAPQGGLVFIPPSIAYTETPPAKFAQADSFTVIIRLNGGRGHRWGCILDYATREAHVNLRMEQHDDQLLFWAVAPDGSVGAGLRLGRVFGNSDTVSAVFSFDGHVLNGWDTHGTSGTTAIAMGSHLHWDSTASLTFGSLVDGKVGWRGTLYAFTVLNRPLQPGTVIAGDSLLAMDDVILSYDLAGGFQRKVRDNGKPPSIGLTIPERYTLPYREILTFDYSPWRRRWFDKDVLLNVAGFFPFGFLVVLMLQKKRHHLLMPVLIALFTGCISSFAIELLQAFLPGRTSSIIDVISNSTGALLGGWLAGLEWPHRVLHQIGIRIIRHEPESITE